MGMHIRKGGKFMKLKKKSGLMGAVIALSAASLVSVGFASWVISQGDTKDVEGDIKVDTVSDNSHLIEVAKLVTAVGSTTDATNKNVVYGTTSNSTEDKWLTNTDSAFLANLQFYLYVKVSNVNADTTIASVIPSAPVVASTLGGTVTISETEYTGYAGAASAVFGKEGASGVNKSLVGGLPTLNASDTKFNANGEAWYSFTFTWGTLTGGANPFDYYNAKDSKVYASEAAECLGYLRTLLNGAKYTITVTTVA